VWAKFVQNLLLEHKAQHKFCFAGHYLSNPSVIIIGNSLLGSIELEHGISAIYQDPWGKNSS